MSQDTLNIYAQDLPFLEHILLVLLKIAEILMSEKIVGEACQTAPKAERRSGRKVGIITNLHIPNL